MIRSLVIIPNTEPMTAQTSKDVTVQPSTLRRNHSQDSLEAFFAEGFNMWINVVSPEEEEIRWLEGLLQMLPRK